MWHVFFSFRGLCMAALPGPAAPMIMPIRRCDYLRGIASGWSSGSHSLAARERATAALALEVPIQKKAVNE
jgi:hypothetical protein